MTLSDWLRQAEARLASAGVETPRLDAQMLAAHVLLVDRSWILAHPEAEINDLAAETLLQRREGREPLAYILGWREFYGRRFIVRPGALIPRQETETLVDAALEVVQDAGETPALSARVLDLGTGSGCIAVTVKLERPDLVVSATDISAESIRIARENADLLEAEIDILEADGLQSFGPDSFDLIVSNPPYIAEGESLMPEVADHEPREALYSGPSGLEFYQRLASETAACLRTGGWVLMEVGHTQAGRVTELFEDACWKQIRTWNDLSGVTRVVGAEKR